MTPGLDENLSMTRSGNTYYYMAEGLGSIRNIGESDEDNANTYDYYAFGDSLGTQTQGVTNPYRFTAREYESGSVLDTCYYRNRYYISALGIFTSRDVMWADGARRWGYVSNCPTLAIDPFGLDTFIIVYTYDEDGLFKRAASYQEGIIRTNRYIDPAKDKIVIQRISGASDLVTLLDSNKDIAKLVYIGHSKPQALYVDPSSYGRDANITPEGGQTPAVKCDSTPVSDLPTKNILPDCQISLLGCRTAKGPDNIAQAFANHFGVPVFGPTGYLNFDSAGRPYISFWDYFSGATFIYVTPEKE